MWSSELMLTITGSADWSFAPWVPPLHRLPLQPCANSFLARWCARLMRGRMEGGGQSQIRWFFTRPLLTDQATKTNKWVKHFLVKKKKKNLSETDINTSASEKGTLEEGAFLWKFKKLSNCSEVMSMMQEWGEKKFCFPFIGVAFGVYKHLRVSFYVIKRRNSHTSAQKITGLGSAQPARRPKIHMGKLARPVCVWACVFGKPWLLWRINTFYANCRLCLKVNSLDTKLTDVIILWRDFRSWKRGLHNLRQTR